MNDKLSNLLEYSKKNVCYSMAADYRAKGGKVVGVLDSLVPEELICAAGMLPIRLRGANEMNTSQARIHRVPQSNLFLNSLLEAAMRGELDFCDAVVCTNRDADYLRFSDVLDSLGKMPVYVVDVPIQNTPPSVERCAREFEKLSDFLSGISGVSVTDEAIRKAVAEYNTGRKALKAINELNLGGKIYLSGADMLRLSLAAASMPREAFNQSILEIVPELQAQDTALEANKPRVLLSTDVLDDPGYVELVEGCGCYVVMNDADTGSRYYWELVDECDEPYYALANRYLKTLLPRFITWEEQFAQVKKWAEQYCVDGILELPMQYDEPRAYRTTSFRKAMQKAGFPFISFEREYHYANEGQLQTRVGAFLEMIQARA